MAREGSPLIVDMMDANTRRPASCTFPNMHALFDANVEPGLCEPVKDTVLAGDDLWNPGWPATVGANRDAFSVLGSRS
jgi:hypothetical protein